jgi:FixJ family two-component response regulator
MRGPELVEHLKSRRPNIAVLCMSGFGEDGLRPHEALELASRFIQKPFRKDTFLRKLKQTLTRSNELRSSSLQSPFEHARGLGSFTWYDQFWTRSSAHSVHTDRRELGKDRSL